MDGVEINKFPRRVAAISFLLLLPLLRIRSPIIHFEFARCHRARETQSNSDGDGAFKVTTYYANLRRVRAAADCA